MAAAEEAGADGAGAVREQDKFLPIANINRIMKEALPHNAKVSKDAKELVQQCVSDFIIYITSQASDKCKREKRKTVNGDDILWSMKSLGFDDAVVILQQYLQKIREAEGEEKSAKSGAANADAQAAAPSAAPSQVPQGGPPPGYQMQAHMGMQPGMTAQGYPMHYGAPMPPQLMVPGVPGQVPPMMLNMAPPGHMMMPTPMHGEHPQQQQQPSPQQAQQQQQQPPPGGPPSQ